MIKTKQQSSTKETVVSKQCDRCKKDYDDIFEMQEFHHIRFTGGYASKFGDETNVECDLCQSCLLIMIKDYMRTNDEYSVI